MAKTKSKNTIKKSKATKNKSNSTKTSSKKSYSNQNKSKVSSKKESLKKNFTKNKPKNVTPNNLSNNKFNLLLRMVLVLFFISIGVSFAFFTASIFSNSSVSGTESITLVVEDTTITVEGVLEFNSAGMYPGHTEVSAIKVSATGNPQLVSYDLIWQGINDIAALNYIVYKSETKLDVSSTCEVIKENQNNYLIMYENCQISNIDSLGEIVKEGVIPNSSEDQTINILNGEEIQAVSSKYYYVIIEYPNSDEEQNSEIGKTFEGTLTIQEHSEKNYLAYLDTVYSVYNENEKIPVVISNNSNSEAKVKVLYKGNILVEEYNISSNKIYEIIPVAINSFYDTLVEGEMNYLSVIITSGDNSYEEKVYFKKEQANVSIVSVTSSLADDNFSYTENTLNINNQLSATNTSVTYTITLKNNGAYSKYKFRNISEIINSNSNSNYSTSIDLATGIFITRNQEYSFDLTYNYNSSFLDNSHREILEFEFKESEEFGGVTTNMMAVSSPENSTDENYGDFETTDSSNFEGINNDTYSCSYSTCYSDNGGNFEYDENGGLVLDGDNALGILNIDQSMSVADEYSIYVTLKGDTNQEGIPTKNYPATILAISEANTKYLSWFGFYKNYLHVYSYYNGSALGNINYAKTAVGFQSVSISEYSNKIINLQIVAIRNGLTKIYINGNLISSFTSGTAPVDYKSATIGDLRPGRGLKFTGVLYDLVLYNKALTEEEVQMNWEHAKSTWNIV